MIASDLDNDETEQMNELNRQLDYLNYVENLAPGIQKNYGFTRDQIPTYRADKLIDVCFNLVKKFQRQIKYIFIHFQVVHEAIPCKRD
jgi:hypothetical protein